jgi:hypothetical protein
MTADTTSPRAAFTCKAEHAIHPTAPPAISHNTTFIRCIRKIL